MFTSINPWIREQNTNHKGWLVLVAEGQATHTGFIQHAAIYSTRETSPDRELFFSARVLLADCDADGALGSTFQNGVFPGCVP